MSEAAEKTRQWTGQEIAPVSLRAAAERGALKATRKGKNWVTTDANLRAYLNSRPQHFKQGQRKDTVDKGVRRVHITRKTRKKEVRVRG